MLEFIYVHDDCVDVYQHLKTPQSPQVCESDSCTCLIIGENTLFVVLNVLPGNCLPSPGIMCLHFAAIAEEVWMNADLWEMRCTPAVYLWRKFQVSLQAGFRW